VPFFCFSHRAGRFYFCVPFPFSTLAQQASFVLGGGFVVSFRSFLRPFCVLLFWFFGSGFSVFLSAFGGLFFAPQSGSGFVLMVFFLISFFFTPLFSSFFSACRASEFYFWRWFCVVFVFDFLRPFSLSSSFSRQAVNCFVFTLLFLSLRLHRKRFFIGVASATGGQIATLIFCALFLLLPQSGTILFLRPFPFSRLHGKPVVFWVVVLEFFSVLGVFFCF
jgi:hypothetical protein